MLLALLLGAISKGTKVYGVIITSSRVLMAQPGKVIYICTTR